MKTKKVKKLYFKRKVQNVVDGIIITLTIFLGMTMESLGYSQVYNYIFTITSIIIIVLEVLSYKFSKVDYL